MPDLRAALAEMREIVGASHVVDDAAGVALRARDTLPTSTDPPAYVYPGSTDQVRRIVACAGRHGISIFPCSKGKNWGYGSSLPPRSDAVVVVLERMNRILEVNEELAYAVIEPGVTYRQLDAHLKKTGSRLWADCTDGPPDGSVIGNAMERGVGETPYGDHFANLCGLEVVLPDASVIRTGDTSAAGSKTWNTFKWGVGPYLEGMFTQANYGVVTRAGIWLMPAPEHVLSFVFDLSDARRFPELIDTVRELALDGVLQTKLHLVNDLVSLALVAEYPWDQLGGSTYIDEALMARMRERYTVSPWSFGSAIYGTRAEVRLRRRRIEKALAPLGELSFLDGERARLLEMIIPRLEASRMGQAISRRLFGKCVEMLALGPHLHGIVRGIPTDYFVRHSYFRTAKGKPASDVDPARDGCGEWWLAPVLPLRGRDVEALLAPARALFREHGLDYYVALLMVNPRSIVALIGIFFRKDLPEEVERATALYEALVALLASQEVQQYRVARSHWKRLFAGAPAYRELLGTLKAAIDPKGIIAPGKYGIE